MAWQDERPVAVPGTKTVPPDCREIARDPRQAPRRACDSTGWPAGALKVTLGGPEYLSCCFRISIKHCIWPYLSNLYSAFVYVWWFSFRSKTKTPDSGEQEPIEMKSKPYHHHQVPKENENSNQEETQKNQLKVNKEIQPKFDPNPVRAKNISISRATIKPTAYTKRNHIGKHTHVSHNYEKKTSVC